MVARMPATPNGPMDFEVLFADGLFGCSATRTVTISCEWDAQGQMAA